MLSQLTNRSSWIVKYRVAYRAERILDWFFLACPFVAVAALGWAARWFWLGWMGLGLAAVLVLGGALLGTYARYIAPWRLRVTHLSVDDNRSGNATHPVPIRVVFFSDLHLARIKKKDWVQRVVNLSNQQKPDVVLIGGDFSGILGKHTFDALLQPLKQLHAPLGVYAVLGNHDVGIPGEDHANDLTQVLPQVGVRLLRNDLVQLNAGVQLLSADELWAKWDDVDTVFAKAATGARRIFLGHNPDLMLKMKPAYTADVFIFGHTHHGQIYIPFLPALAVPIRSQFYRGTFHTPNGMVYVSSGCGEGNSPIRINTRPEIVVFEI